MDEKKHSRKVEVKFSLVLLRFDFWETGRCCSFSFVNLWARFLAKQSKERPAKPAILLCPLMQIFSKMFCTISPQFYKTDDECDECFVLQYKNVLFFEKHFLAWNEGLKNIIPRLQQNRDGRHPLRGSLLLENLQEKNAQPLFPSPLLLCSRCINNCRQMKLALNATHFCSKRKVNSEWMK